MISYLTILIVILFAYTYFSFVEKSLYIIWYNGNSSEIPLSYFFTALMLKNLLAVILVVEVVLFVLSNFPAGIFYLFIFLTILLLVLIDLVSDSISVKIPSQILIFSKRILHFISKMLLPVNWVIQKALNYQVLFRNSEISVLPSLDNKNELNTFLSRIPDKEESNILNKVLELSNIRVYEAMRPRTEIVGVEINSTIEEVLDILIESGYSKIPVFEESLDNIKGIILANDLFYHPQKLSDIIRDVIFVPETKKCADMLKEFSEKRISFAVAVDEFGGTAGILTMEDILEELFGEIEDEYDIEDAVCKELGNNIYIISGKVEIDYINDTLNLDIHQGDYATIGGFITFHSGKIPLKGDSIKIDKFNFNILRSNQLRIELVKLTVLQN